MDESREPKRPIPPPGPPGQPLRRIWKHEPDDDDEEYAVADPQPGPRPKPVENPPPPPAEPRRRKTDASPPRKDARAQGRTSILREETPNLDTVETRQRIRILVGAGVVGLLGLVALLIYQAIKPDSVEDEPIDFGAAVAAAPVGPDRARAEKEAGELLDRAWQVAENGNATLAATILERLVKSYPGTNAAGTAKEALARPARNLPLFLDRPTVVASEVERPAPATEPEVEPVAVVEASPGQPTPAKGAVADLHLPTNAPEPPAIAAPTVPAHPSIAARPLPKGFNPREGTAVHESGWPIEIVGQRDGAPMVLVPGGDFFQGRDGADAAEAPAHKVRLSTYYVDQHEVTVRQFKIFQRETGRRQERDRAIARDDALANLDDDDERPVVMVSAREASDYARWAGKRLPTEAQWEAAGRTPDGRLFPWGSDAEPAKGRTIQPVQTFRKDVSPYGAFDLGGNAWEWTKDWYDARSYQSFRNTQADDPTGPANRPRSSQLVIKGGSPDWALSHREGLRYDARLPHLGFRCVLPVEGPGNVFDPPPAPGTRTPSGATGGSGAIVPF
ncbi:MAG: SUMF1/EgtB/PvdO family nonheme iron enzyme [Isosphaeraceae bacterium]